MAPKNGQQDLEQRRAELSELLTENREYLKKASRSERRQIERQIEHLERLLERLTGRWNR